ncbi:MAG TPA: glycoside hydrolase family 38 C-terminal domain-containing protein [Candidatus Angelobacter sp.]|nr:glycoside hydrolase family 38 C-terminal domain-containing protein [Candidatus Angelobacter sp.]
MQHNLRRLSALVFLLSLLACQAVAEVPKGNKPAKTSLSTATKPDPGLDLTKQPTLFVVGYAHLDTEWRWEYPQVIREYLVKTLHDNFDLFGKYPHYIFNFSGANRYRLMKEYYPADYAKLKQFVASGRWFPAGSSMEESDVNGPSAESIFRQVLYGNQFFRRDFNKASAEYMLPDCFGFPASLPSILAHAGIKGFSTQKLTWHSAAQVGGPGSVEETPVGIPFNLGFWQGPDGNGVLAAMNPGSYSADIRQDLSKSDPTSKARDYVDWPKRIELNGKASGVFTDYHYYGVGDTGGAPREPSVRLLEAIVGKSKAVLPAPQILPGQQPPATTSGPEVQVGDGPLRVISATADQMFLDIPAEQVARFPRYQGDLELTEHSAGSLTSQAYQKRWNRKNELLADAAEKASIAAMWLGGREYPQQRLNDAWTLVMGGQFHDIMAGTATPKSYEFSWNDDVVAMNQFAGVLTSATEAVASALDTQTKGTPIVVYNPLNIEREDVVEADAPNNGAVLVFGPDGKAVPTQVQSTSGGTTKVLFLAKVPSVGYAVYDVRPSTGVAGDTPLRVDQSSLENGRYRVRLDENGDIASIFDKSLNKELLSGPARLAFQTEKPHDWPAWNMDWTDQQKPPRSYVGGPAKVGIVENGPVRVALQVEREAEGSKFVQTIRLSAGDAGNRVEFGNVIDWQTAATALKATFPLAAANPQATYNWDVGTIQRGNNDPKKYEVPSHQWFDLTDKSGEFGVTILSDCKNGSDKPDDNTLRLTLIYTPGLGDGNGRFYSDQTTQDWGHHEFTYGLAGHAGDWRKEQTDWQGQRLNQPLIAFQTAPHPGVLGKSFSLLHLNNSRVRVLATKKAEQSDEIVVRVVELDGKPAQDVHITFAAPIMSAREINAQELPIEGGGKAALAKGSLTTNLGAYQPRTFAVKLAAPQKKMAAPRSQPVSLSYDLAAASTDGSKSSGGFDAQGNALPAEMLPRDVAYAGIHFQLAPAQDGKPNAVAAKGQTISLPSGKFNRLHILAAADGDQKAAFKIGDTAVDMTIQDWGGFIGQWDNRNWNKKQEPVPPRPGAPAVNPPRMRTILEYKGLTPGFIKRAPVAWYASHHHTPDGANEPYAYSYLFAYSAVLPANAHSLTLPNNDKIRILAVTVADESAEVTPAQPLYDVLRDGDQSAK